MNGLSAIQAFAASRRWLDWCNARVTTENAWLDRADAFIPLVLVNRTEDLGSGLGNPVVNCRSSEWWQRWSSSEAVVSVASVTSRSHKGEARHKSKRGSDLRSDQPSDKPNVAWPGAPGLVWRALDLGLIKGKCSDWRNKEHSRHGRLITQRPQ
jgi:hypothetical protein